MHPNLGQAIAKGVGIRRRVPQLLDLPWPVMAGTALLDRLFGYQQQRHSPAGHLAGSFHLGYFLEIL